MNAHSSRTAPCRVVMFSNLYPPVVSGSSTQSSFLARELCRRGCEVAVITARLDADSPEHEKAAGVHVYRLPALRLPRLPIALNFPWLNCTFTPGNLRSIARIIDRHRPDVLHLHNHMFDLSFPAVLTRRRKKVPLVVTLHTMIKHTRALYNLLLYPLDRLFLRHCVIKHADRVLCPDVNIQEYAVQAFGRKDAQIVPYGVSLPGRPDEHQMEVLRHKHQLQGKRIILSLGHVHDLRNRKDLIEALPLVKKAVPNVVLLLVGAVSTTLPDELARRLGVRDSLILAGAAPHAEVPAYLALADLEAHWLNQDLPEKTSLGIASLESMSAGLTILAAANPDTYGKGVLQDGSNVVLVRPGQPRQLADTIVGLLEHPLRCRSIGARAAQTIQTHFSWSSIGERTLQVYTESLGNRQTVRQGEKLPPLAA